MGARPQGLRPLGAIMAGMAGSDAPLGRAIAAGLAVDFSSESLDHARRGLADLDEAGRMTRRKTRPVLDRFFDKVVFEPNCGCWLWTGTLDNRRRDGGKKGGYAEIFFNGRVVRAQRLAYEMLVGPIPDGAVLDHLCRVRCCVNPAHLEPVTNKQNLLRGVGFAAANARKTHCPEGHPLSGDNVYKGPNGWRYCRQCRAKRNHSSYLKRKAARHGASPSIGDDCILTKTAGPRHGR